MSTMNKERVNIVWKARAIVIGVVSTKVKWHALAIMLIFIVFADCFLQFCNLLGEPFCQVLP